MALSMSTVVVTDVPQLVYFNGSGDVSYVVLSPTDVATPLVRPFRDAGGAGSYDANVDGSSTPVVFEVLVADGEIVHLDSISFMIFDTGSISPEKYGAVATLANGVTATAYVAALDVTVDILAGRAMHNIADWASVAFNHVYSPGGPGTEYVAFNWEVYPKGAHARQAAFVAGDRIMITVNDDLTGLAGHIFTAKGQTVSPLVKLGTSGTFSPATSYQVAESGVRVEVPPGDSLFAGVDPGQGVNVMGATVYD